MEDEARFEEIKKFKDRVTNEYLDLLEYRKPLLKQLELEQFEVSKIPQKDRKIIELIMKVGELERQLKEKTTQAESKREAESKDQVLAYTERLKKEYQELLNLRGGILEQSKEDTEALRQINAQKEQVISQITNDILLANKEVADLRNSKSDIIRELAGKEIKIAEKENNLAVREATLLDELNGARKTKEQYQNESNVIAKERKELAEEKDQVVFKKQMIEQVLGTEEKRLKDLTQLKTTLINKNKTQKKILKGIVVKELKVKQRTEASAKKEDFLNQKQIEIDRDRKHLESQQETLKRAFQEAKKKGING